MLAEISHLVRRAAPGPVGAERRPGGAPGGLRWPRSTAAAAVRWFAATLLLIATPAAAQTCTDPDGGRYHVRLYSGHMLAVNPDWEMRIREVLGESRRAPEARPADPVGCPGNPLVVPEFRFAFGHNLGLDAGGDYALLGWRPYLLQLTSEDTAMRGLARNQFAITCDTHPEARSVVAGVTICRVPRSDAPVPDWPAVYRFDEPGMANADGTPMDVNCTIDGCRADLLLAPGLALVYSLRRPRRDDAAFIALNREIVARVRSWLVPGLDRPDLRADPRFGAGQ